MTLNGVHIVVAKDAKGVLVTLYAGEDAAAAEQAYTGADAALEIVGVVSYPQFTRQRFPTAEVQLERQQAEASLNTEQRAAKLREVKAIGLRQEAEKLLKQAEGLSPAAKAPRSTLSDAGPTIEEFVKAGYDPKGYPPSGYAEKPSEGLTYFRANGKMPEAPAPAPVTADLLPPPTSTAKPEAPATGKSVKKQNV